MFTASSISLSRIATAIFYISILWVSFTVTHSPVYTGIADGLVTLPLFLSFAVGSFVDNSIHKKFIAILFSLIRACSVVPLLFTFLFNQKAFLIIFLFLFAFSVGLTSDFINSVRAVWIKKFLKEGEKVKRYRAFSNILYNISEGLGYILVGFLISTGVTFTLIFVLLIYLTSTIPISLIKVYEEPKRHQLKAGARKLSDPLNFIRKSPIVLVLFTEGFLVNFIFGMFGVLTTVMVVRIFQLPALYLSVIYLILTLGISIGSFLERKEGFPRLNRVFWSIAVLAVMLIALSYITQFIYVLLPMFIIGISIGVSEIIIFSGIQNNVPEEITGTIQGYYNSLATGLTFLSAPITGILVQFTGYHNTFFLISTFSLAIILIIIWRRTITHVHRN
ncbi:MFS transporter [Ferroplasma acidiphilum]|nr:MULTISPECIES: MFS transporter [Thermoplasmatales]MCI2413100.1 MFS transporter [Cuniculiplasma sp.]